MELGELVQRLESLEQQQDSLRSALQTAQQERDAYHQLYLDMLERCRKLERGLLAQGSEKRPKNEQQLSLDMLGMMLSEREKAEIEALPAEHIEVKGHTRQHRGRNLIPESLPRVDIEIIPDEVQREGLDAFERIGEEVTEVIERRPGAFVVARIIKPKFVRRDRDRNGATEVLVGATPRLPIERGVAGPGLLADTIVRRWQDHSPLNRLEGIYARDGIELARSTMCTWHTTLATMVEPLVAAMRQDCFEQPLLCTDATGVLVQAKDKCRRGHFWVVIAPGKHVLFEYTPDHTGDSVDGILAGYSGYLVADAHAVYDHLYVSGDVVEVNCWAHCRRYFFAAMSSDPDRARIALGLIGMLFKIERSIAEAPRNKREKIRAKHSAPVVERFYSWCEAEWPTLLEDSPVYDGVRYARNQREGLSRFLTDGRLPIHNNNSERELRRQAVGRRNWLFVGNDDGGKVNALFTTLLASCQMMRVEPWAYLRDLFCVLPTWPAHRLLELAPAHWADTVAHTDTQALLDADPYRRLTLGAG